MLFAKPWPAVAYRDLNPILLERCRHEWINDVPDGKFNHTKSIAYEYRSGEGTLDLAPVFDELENFARKEKRLKSTNYVSNYAHPMCIII